MKRVFLVSLYILASIAMNSCSTDDLENNNEKPKVSAELNSGGSQNGQTSIPQPKR